MKAKNSTGFSLEFAHKVTQSTSSKKSSNQVAMDGQKIEIHSGDDDPEEILMIEDEEDDEEEEEKVFEFSFLEA